jgi:phosphonate transport system substrate-binding protein
MTTLTTKLIAAAFAVALAGTAAAQQKCEDPKVLRFSIIPTEETIQELTIYKPVIDILSKNTGKKIEFYMPTSYASVIEAMLGNWVDIAVHGPASYVIGNEKSKTIEVFATYAKAKGIFQEEGPGYHAVLVAKKGTKFTDVKALKGAVVALAARSAASSSKPTSRRSSTAAATTNRPSPCTRARPTPPSSPRTGSTT